mgnify:CR=1 FL=1
MFFKGSYKAKEVGSDFVNSKFEYRNPKQILNDKFKIINKEIKEAEQRKFSNQKKQHKKVDLIFDIQCGHSLFLLFSSKLELDGFFVKEKRPRKG